MANYNNSSIKNWIAEDRPREKMIARGKDALTDAELLATLIASGTQKHSALDLARILIERFGSVTQLSRASVEDLCQVPGIGPAKASIISAAFELARRGNASTKKVIRFKESKYSGEYLCSLIGNEAVEVFYVLFLDNHCNLMSQKQLFKGGKTYTAADPRVIMKEAIARQAHQIIVAHNHPSNILVPSIQDDNVTKEIIAFGKLANIRLLDHFIVGTNNWYSYADNGMIKRYENSVNKTYQSLIEANKC